MLFLLAGEPRGESRRDIPSSLLLRVSAGSATSEVKVSSHGAMRLVDR